MATATKTAKDILLGFGLGWSQVTLGNRTAIQDKIMAALGVNNRASFNNYKSGRQRVTFDQAEKIEQIFQDYGIKKVWGNFIENAAD